MPATAAADHSLPSPLGSLSTNLSTSDLRITAYEVFVAVCRTSSAKPLSQHSSVSSSPGFNSSPNSSKSNGGGNAGNSSGSSSSPVLQRSLTSAAASKMKKALGLKSPGSGSKKGSPTGSGGKPVSASNSGTKKPATVGDLMRVQMHVSEGVDSRIRRALLRVSASQLGKRIELIVLPLEMLQQLKQSDFTDQQEFEAWQKRTMKVLEAGMLLHPRVPLDKSNAAAQRLRQIINGAIDRPMETGKNNEAMQVLRNTVLTLAGRSDGSFSEISHWADGFPLNLRLYEMLLESCFDINDEGSMLEEADELLEHIKKTWPMLGINQMFHNLCFTWVLFHRFVISGHVETVFLEAVEAQLVEVAKDAKSTKDPDYSKVLSSALSSILGWAEQRLLAYHDTFDGGNVETMQLIVSIGVAAAKILVEDISDEYRRKRKGEVDVARSRVDTYIRSSLRTAFAQLMEKADSSRRAAKHNLHSLPILAILAKDVGDLAIKEKHMYSPILKRWHSLAAGVAVATLHTCYANEIKQFISGIVELTPDAVEVLRAADKLEKDLVQIAVEDSVDSEDGGKAIIREMPPFEAETAIANLVKSWIKSRIEKLRERVDRKLQQEVWSPQSSEDGFAPSAADVLRLIDETLESYFQLPIPGHPALLPELVSGLDRCLQYYATKAKSGCGSRSSYIPAMPALTRCEVGSKLWKKKEKPGNLQKVYSHSTAVNGTDSAEIPQLCLRINTLHKIKSELEVIEKRIITHLRNSESATVEDFSNGLAKNFELTPAACVEAVQQLSEATAYKIVYKDLNHLLLDGLYIGEPSSSRIDHFIQELERTLKIVANNVQDRVGTRVIADIMRASFEGFLHVLLAGGPARVFTCQDSRIIEDDFKALKDLFWADGDGLPADLIDKFSSTARCVLPLFRSDTDTLIERYRRLTLEAYGSSAKSKLPLPPTSGKWDPTEPNTLLRVLCHRHDETATKFLKKTYNLPKKL